MKHWTGAVIVPPPASSRYAIPARPRTGSLVRWDAIPAVDKDADQAAQARFTLGGIIGERTYHLPRYGGHTPWRQGSVVGMVWAIDIHVSEAAWTKILATLRSGRFDRLVRFVNHGGRQYSSTDSFRSWSSNSDQHLHIEYADTARFWTGPSLLQAALAPPPTAPAAPVTLSGALIALTGG